MTRYVNRWTGLLAWAALMGIVWAIFVPRGLSVGTFTLLGLTGPLALLAGRPCGLRTGPRRRSARRARGLTRRPKRRTVRK